MDDKAAKRLCSAILLQAFDDIKRVPKCPKDPENLCDEKACRRFKAQMSDYQQRVHDYNDALLFLGSKQAAIYAEYLDINPVCLAEKISRKSIIRGRAGHIQEGG